MGQIMVEGRWSSEASCRLYLKTVEAQLLMGRRALEDGVSQRVEVIANLWPCFIPGDDYAWVLSLSGKGELGPQR